MSIKLSGSGNYIEPATTSAPTNAPSGKVRIYAVDTTSLRVKDSSGNETILTDPLLDDEILMDF